MNLKNIRNMVVFFTLVAFTTSCSTTINNIPDTKRSSKNFPEIEGMREVYRCSDQSIPALIALKGGSVRQSERWGKRGPRRLDLYYLSTLYLRVPANEPSVIINADNNMMIMIDFFDNSSYLLNKLRSISGYKNALKNVPGVSWRDIRNQYDEFLNFLPHKTDLQKGDVLWFSYVPDIGLIVSHTAGKGIRDKFKNGVTLDFNFKKAFFSYWLNEYPGIVSQEMRYNPIELEKKLYITEYQRLYEIKDVSNLQAVYNELLFTIRKSEREYILSNIDSFEINSEWDTLSVFVSARMHSYLNPDPPSVPEIPEKIPEPELPAVQEIAKSPFESRSAFKARMEKMKNQRNNQIQDLLQAHIDKVDARNAEIRRLKADYEAQLKKHEKEVRLRQQNRDKKSQQYMVELFPEIFGEAKLVAAHTEDGAPKYDPENNIMYATLYYGLKNNPKLEKPIAFPNVPEGGAAEAFYKILRSGEIRPHVDFSFENNFFAFHSVTPGNFFKKYVGKESFSEFKKGEEIKVVLGHDEKDARTRLSQAKKVDFEMQSASVKDVKFEVWMANEMREYNDDIPAMLEKAASVPVDKSRWLFVIGIEEYRNTNRINFSRRSSELFTEVAMKRLGIDSSRVFLLVDDGKTVLDAVPANRVHPATAGSIKDQMRYLVRDIEPGDTIYFYYSGHGVPAIDDERRPYIMAQDQAPDFVSYEKELRIQEIYTTLSNSGAGRVMAFMDSCFTGETDGRSVFMGDIGSTRLVPRETTFDKETMAVITAGTKNQFSNVYREKGHRLFSYYLMQALLKDYESVGPFFREIQTNTRSTSRDFGGANLQTPTLEGNAMLRLR